MSYTISIKHGTWVRLKPSSGKRGLAIVLADNGGGSFNLETDGSSSMFAGRHDFAVLPDQPGLSTLFVSRRKTLPYGLWTCADGRQVLINRNYEPIWKRQNGGPAWTADPTEQFSKIGQHYYYTDKNPPWNDKRSDIRCQSILEEWGVELPELQPF